MIHHDDGPPPEGFSDDERRALTAWRAPEPPPGFAGRIVALAATPSAGERGSASRRGLLLAGALALGLGGLAVTRVSSGDASGRGRAPAYDDGTAHAAALAPDGGIRAEVASADEPPQG